MTTTSFNQQIICHVPTVLPPLSVRLFGNTSNISIMHAASTAQSTFIIIIITL